MTSGGQSGTGKGEFGKQSRLWLGASLTTVAIGFGFFGYGIHVAENPKERFFAAMAAAIVSAAVSVFFVLQSRRARKEEVEAFIDPPRDAERFEEAIELTKGIGSKKVEIRMLAVLGLALGGRQISDRLMRDVMGIEQGDDE